MDFKDLIMLSGMTEKEIRIFLNISIRTFQRYKLSNKAPKATSECLKMIAGFCPSFAKRNDFTGWSFGNGYLWNPEGERFTSGDIRAGKIASLEINRLHRIDVRKRKEAKKKAFNKVSCQIIPFPIGRVKKNILA